MFPPVQPAELTMSDSSLSSNKQTYVAEIQACATHYSCWCTWTSSHCRTGITIQHSGDLVRATCYERVACTAVETTSSPKKRISLLERAPGASSRAEKTLNGAAGEKQRFLTPHTFGLASSPQAAIESDTDHGETAARCRVAVA